MEQRALGLHGCRAVTLGLGDLPIAAVLGLFVRFFEERGFAVFITLAFAGLAFADFEKSLRARGDEIVQQAGVGNAAHARRSVGINGLLAQQEDVFLQLILDPLGQ